MGTTPNGLPYPEGTAFLIDGDNAITALAKGTDQYPGGRPHARATLATSAIPGGRTGWGLTAAMADPSGLLVIGANGITCGKAGVVLVQMSMTGAGAGSVSMMIAADNPNTGPIIGSVKWPGAGQIILFWPLAGPTSLHPVFDQQAGGVTCQTGSFDVAYLGPRAAASWLTP